MKRTALLLSLGIAALHTHAQDQCSTALPITLGTYTVAAVNGSEVPSPICAPSASSATAGEWYAFTATIDTTLTLTTDLPQNGGGDTRFHVYTGVCGALVCHSGDDDSGTLGSGYLSVASFPVTAGTTYTIAFDNYWSSTGFDFQLAETTPPPPSAFTAQSITTVGSYMYCITDMNSDGLDDEVDVSGSVIHVNYQLSGGGFTSTNIVTSGVVNTPSWSMCAGDLDGNGYNDLMYGSGGGVTLMLANANGTAFTPTNEPEYIFCQRTNMVDINNDGHLDAFSCHDVDANCYYLNDGNNNFVFYQGGLGEDCGNYGSIWTDYDNDGDMDLFVAKCGCDPIDIMYRNNGDGTFTDIAGVMGFGDTQQSWSSAWGDFDNDGDMDALVGTSSADYQKLMRNDLGSFTNVTLGSGFDTFLGNSIEWTTHDFDNDGYLDILGGGGLMMNNGDMTFTLTDPPLTNGPIGDLNNDGFLDVQNGGTIYMNNGNANHWIKIIPVGTVSNTNAIGARVKVTSALGSQIRDIKSGDGFRYMSSLFAYFGLGADDAVTNVTVYWPSGLVSTVDNPAVDAPLTITEDINTDVQAIPAQQLSVFPSPAQDELQVSSSFVLTDRAFTITDVSGKQVLRSTVGNGTIDVSSLNGGVYLLRILGDGPVLQCKFIKR